MNESLTLSQIVKAQDQVEDPTIAFAKDVLKGLNTSPKRLSSVYFYDERGSQIFEDICDLDEYYLTRKETEILKRHADEIISNLPFNTHLIELGSGSSTKTRIILEAALQRFTKTQYSPIDVSPEILEHSVNDLHARYPDLQLEAVAGRYEFGMEHILKNSSNANCIMWLGSSIGNLTREEATQFLQDLRSNLHDDDCLLLGIDLRKDAAILEPAYDDVKGVTAEFNLNLLDRINTELGGTFNRDQFKHRAVYNEGEGRIEMYLVSNENQQVQVQTTGSRIPFQRNETILTEYSYKYSLAEIQTLAEDSGFILEKQWLDDDEWFSLNCFKPKNNTLGLRVS